MLFKRSEHHNHIHCKFIHTYIHSINPVFANTCYWIWNMSNWTIQLDSTKHIQYMYTTTTLVLYGLRPYSIINLIVLPKAIINLIKAAATSLLFTIRSIVHHTYVNIYFIWGYLFKILVQILFPLLPSVYLKNSISIAINYDFLIFFILMTSLSLQLHFRHILVRSTSWDVYVWNSVFHDYVSRGICQHDHGHGLPASVLQAADHILLWGNKQDKIMS